MVRTRNTDSEERSLSEFELHEKGYGKRLASLLGLGIGMGVLAAILSLFIGGTSEVAEDATEATGDVGDAASDATGDADSVSDAAGKATEAAGELGSNLAQIDRDAANAVSGAAGNATENAGELGSNIAEGTQDAVSGAANAVSGAADDATENAGELGSNIAGGTQDTADGAANAVSGAADDATENAGELGSNIAGGTQDTADGAANAVSGAAGNATENAGELGSNIAEGTQDAVSSATVGEAVNSLQSGEWDVNRAITAKPDNPILFDYSSAELTTQGKQTISKLAQEINQLNSKQVAVKLVGHASKTGNPQSNLILSQYRADTVAEELRNLGVENTIETEGKGYNEPITNIPADNARQQRTEVKLIRVK